MKHLSEKTNFSKGTKWKGKLKTSFHLTVECNAMNLHLNKNDTPQLLVNLRTCKNINHLTTIT